MARLTDQEKQRTPWLGARRRHKQRRRIQADGKFGDASGRTRQCTYLTLDEWRIAHELHISLSTVKTHLATVLTKLGARNHVEIAMWAYETARINR